MSVDQWSSRHQAYLGPDDLRLAADTFETALFSVQEVACDFPPYKARQLLARYVMERVLRGDRDPVQLREYAFDRLGRVPSPSPPSRRALAAAKLVFNGC